MAKANNLSDILESITDYDLNKRNYAAILKHLDSNEKIDTSDLKKLIALCIQQLKKKNTFGISALKIISSVLKKQENEKWPHSPDLLVLLLGILNTLQFNARFSKIESLKALCLEVVLQFSDSLLGDAAVHHPDKFYNLVEQYCQETVTELVFQTTLITLKLLRTLPACSRHIFVENGLNTWFSALLPSILKLSFTPVPGLDSALECVEVITDELLSINYFDNAHWNFFFQYLSVEFLTNLSQISIEQNEHWHRIWKICVKLMKNLLTQPTATERAPIKSLLSVVETAFKMGSQIRCGAFECWNLLIQNIFTENSASFDKKVKLLLIPLLSNNAKNEMTAKAKFFTWWHFILNFHEKKTNDDVPEMMESTLLHFINFCFGHPLSKTQVVPGQISDATKLLCLQGLVNLLGHYNCSGCTNINRTRNKLISTQQLLQYEKHWFHSLSTVIKNYTDISAQESSIEVEKGTFRKQLKCAWISFIVAIADVSQSKLRISLFKKLLIMIHELLKECSFEMSDVAVNVLIPSVFEAKNIIDLLVKGQDEILSVIHDILVDSSNNLFYSKCNIDNTVQSTILFTNYIVENDTRGTSKSFGPNYFLANLPDTECGLILWTSYIQSLMKNELIPNPQLVADSIIWPIKLNISTNAEKYASMWLIYYNHLSITMKKNKKTQDLLYDKLLLFFSEHKSVNTVLSLTAIIALIKQSSNDKGKILSKKVYQLLTILKKQIREVLLLPLVYFELLNCLVAALNIFQAPKMYTACAKLLLTIINNVLKITTRKTNLTEDNETNKKMLHHVEKLLESVEIFFKIKSFVILMPLIVSGLKEVATQFAEIVSIRKCVLCILNRYKGEDKQIKELIRDIFTKETANTLNTVPMAAKDKKNSLNIVDTVVEDGMEYVVVKSNWKFNPKKLTETQKEKLLRKRDDIPALYQDMSQSQDQFLLSAWKTDSTDATSSSKSSTVDEPRPDATTRVDDDVLPNIKNDLSDNDSENNNLGAKPSAEVKSPRMCLANRVFRNVRNLIENSDLSTASPRKSASPPPPDTIRSKDVKSAPPVKPARPLRTIKTPRKFDDSAMFGVRRRRHSSYIERSHAADHFEVAHEFPQSNDTPKRAKLAPLSAARAETPNLSSAGMVDKSSAKKSRIEKSLRIDMVEGHPFLNAQDTENIGNKRNTRRKSAATLSTTAPPHSTDTNTPENVTSKTKPQSQNISLYDDKVENSKKMSKSVDSNGNETCVSTGELKPESTVSQDIIESSQDSSLTTISTASKMTKVLIVPIERIETAKMLKKNINDTSKGDSELPKNTTVDDDTIIEEMATELMDSQAHFINISDTQQTTRMESSDKQTDSEIVAAAATEPLDFNLCIDVFKEEMNDSSMTRADSPAREEPQMNEGVANSVQTVTGEEHASSPLKGDEQRKKDFLNSTLEISPIKIVSPVRGETPSPETSSDYVVVNVSVPVPADCEHKCNSPEIFTDDKVTSDEKDLSPTRQDKEGIDRSPASCSASKKSRPQLRFGRGAQMLDLCVVSRPVPYSAESVEGFLKKPTVLNATVKRNLKNVYNTESYDSSDTDTDNEQFLKLKRNLPSTKSSPAGPILKRKHAEMTDDATPSPANKKKRVSFHDPPVSTMMCVKKYIEPLLPKSPQNSTVKQQETSQNRSPNKTPKSMKRLERVLSNTIDSFDHENATDDTLTSSVDRTPAVDVVKTSDLNDVDPVCPELVDCEDPIDVIAAELSSPAMRSLLVKEFDGKIRTVGDLARMTELEINRSCIKAPKVEVAKKVLEAHSKSAQRVINSTDAALPGQPDAATLHEKETSFEGQVDASETSRDVTEPIEVQSRRIGSQREIDENDEKTVDAIMEKLILRNPTRAMDKIKALLALISATHLQAKTNN